MKIRRIICIIIISFLCNNCQNRNSSDYEYLLSDNDMRLYESFFKEIGVEGLDNYDLVIIYDGNGCYDCTILAENYIIPKCLGNNSLVLRISEMDEKLFDFQSRIVNDRSRLFWRYPFKSHRNQLINFRLKKIQLIDYVGEDDLLCD